MYSEDDILQTFQIIIFYLLMLYVILQHVSDYRTFRSRRQAEDCDQYGDLDNLDDECDDNGDIPEIDNDDDNNGIPELQDNFDNDGIINNYDFDNDGIINSIDDDDDNDGE